MVREEKIRAVEELKQMLESYRVIGLVDMFKMPAKQLQEIRKEVRGEALIKVVKKSLLKLAIEKASKENLKELEKHMPQQPAIVLTNLDAFQFYKKISQIKSKAPAKAGDIAPRDILIKAGPTNLMPGPVISEFSKAGIPAGVEQGRIAIKKDVVAAKKGEKISEVLANILRKLGIEPMEISLNVVAIYSDGKIYSKETLELVNIYPEKIKEAFSRALSLSIGICYPTKENIRFLIGKAFNLAKNLENLIRA